MPLFAEVAIPYSGLPGLRKNIDSKASTNVGYVLLVLVALTQKLMLSDLFEADAIFCPNSVKFIRALFPLNSTALPSFPP